MKDLDNTQLLKVTLDVNIHRMSAVKDVLQLTSCPMLCQPIIHSPHHVLETFRPFLVKVTGAAQSDFGLVQLQVDRKAAQLDLSWCAKGRLLYFKSDTLRVRPPLQLAMVLRGSSSRLEAGRLQIGTLRADDSHRVKPDAFQATYLDLCPLKSSLPSSPVESH